MSLLIKSVNCWRLGRDIPLHEFLKMTSRVVKTSEIAGHRSIKPPLDFKEINFKQTSLSVSFCKHFWNSEELYFFLHLNNTNSAIYKTISFCRFESTCFYKHGLIWIGWRCVFTNDLFSSFKWKECGELTIWNNFWNFIDNGRLKKLKIVQCLFLGWRREDFSRY